MDSTNAAARALADLVPPHKYQAAREHCFPSASSLDWFIRTHRRRLIDAGAILQVAGRNLVNEPRFDEIVLEVGREKLAAEPA